MEMMIFTDLEIPNRNLHCPTDFVSTNGDFDVLVISNKFVLFCQVKGVDDGTSDGNKRDKLRDAWEQSAKDRRRFCEATRDLSFVPNIPMHEVIAVPNLNSRVLDRLGICRYHRQFILTASDVEPFTHFVVWVSNIVDRNDRLTTKKVQYRVEHYKILLSRFVGLISKVRINTEGRSIIDTDRIVNPKSYVKASGKRNNCRTQGGLYAILTPKQTHIIHSVGKLAIIRGDFGTGKSLALVIKATKLLEDTENPCHPMVISLGNFGNDGACYHKTNFQACHHLRALSTHDSVIVDVNELIKSYLHENNLASDERRTKIAPELFLSLLSWKIKTTKNVVHFFFDEVPSSFVKKCESVFHQFPEHFPDSYMWLSIAPHSSKPAQPMHRDLEIVLDRLIDKGYHDARLERSMRVPRNVFNFVQFMQQKEFPSLDPTICGHVVSGPKPLFFEIPKCTCQRPRVNDFDVLHCQCSERRLSLTLERVLARCNLRDSATQIDQSKVCILIGVLLGSKFAKPLISLLAKTCASLKVRLLFNVVDLLSDHCKAVEDDIVRRTLNSDREWLEIRVFDQYTYLGCENAVIIGIDPYSLFQCGEGNHWTHSMNIFTRTTSLYIHVHWPKEEAAEMWYADLDAHDALTASRTYLTEYEKYARFEFTARGRESKGDLVEKLIDSNLIIKIPVKTEE